MKSITLSLLTILFSTSAFATNVQCSFEHGETGSYNASSQRLVIVDPHTSHPKVETLIFTKVKLAPVGKLGSDGKPDRAQLVDAKDKVIMELERKSIENPETGKLAEFTGTWDVGFGKLVGACSLTK